MHSLISTLLFDRRWHGDKCYSTPVQVQYWYHFRQPGSPGSPPNQTLTQVTPKILAFRDWCPWLNFPFFFGIQESFGFFFSGFFEFADLHFFKCNRSIFFFLIGSLLVSGIGLEGRSLLCVHGRSQEHFLVGATSNDEIKLTI